MPREKENYRDILEMLLAKFPGRVTITPKEAAEVTGANIKTIYDAIKRVKNPLPSMSLAKKKIVIPIAAFARWIA